MCLCLFLCSQGAFPLYGSYSLVTLSLSLVTFFNPPESSLHIHCHAPTIWGSQSVTFTTKVVFSLSLFFDCSNLIIPGAMCHTLGTDVLLHGANGVGCTPGEDNMDLETTQVTTPEPLQVNSTPLTASVASSFSMQVQEAMVPALATRSTDAVIENLRRRALCPKEPTHENLCPVDSAGGVPRRYGEGSAVSEAIQDEDGGNDTESDEEYPAHPSENQELSYEKSVRESYIRSRVLQATKGSTVPKTKDDDKQSVKWLIKDSGGQVIISSPREYQVELFERAKVQNTIAVLDTGSGKTLIAALLLRHVIDEELEHRANGADKRIAFFLVDSVALVFQQYAVLKCNLNQKMESFCGDMGCEIGRAHV